jgi:hypothetical protein
MPLAIVWTVITITDRIVTTVITLTEVIKLVQQEKVK